MVNDTEFYKSEKQAESAKEISAIEQEYDDIQSGRLTLKDYTEKRLQRKKESYYERNHDPLTELLNRRGFGREFVKILGSQIRRYRDNNAIAVKGSLLLFDIDHFKKYNDTYGHSKGDEVLVKVAKTLTDILERFGDIAGRFGGEEFMAYLPDTDEEGAVAVAEKFRTALTDVKVSIGVSTLSQPSLEKLLGSSLSGEGVQIGILQTLTENADEAMYRAKEQGRNQVVIAKNEPTVIS